MDNISDENGTELLGEPDSRNKLQKTAMFAIYDVLTYIDMQEPIDVQGIVSGLADLPYEQCDYFVKAAVIETLKHLQEIIPVYNTFMNKWTFDRLNRVEQAILLLSYVHYYYIEEGVDKGVVIDVAIRLSKVYLEPKDYKFVNAILDKVLTDEKRRALSLGQPA
jgi:transcription termination factor NusB